MGTQADNHLSLWCHFHMKKKCKRQGNTSCFAFEIRAHQNFRALALLDLSGMLALDKRYWFLTTVCWPFMGGGGYWFLTWDAGLWLGMLAPYQGCLPSTSNTGPCLEVLVLDLRHWPLISVCWPCLLYTSPSPRDSGISRMPSSA